jgi:hypothetical protein
MRRLLPVVLLAMLAAATVTFAASKTYQYTGTVKAVDASTFTVEKSASDTSTFDLGTATAPKVGDKVTVTYKMVATAIVKK